MSDREYDYETTEIGSNNKEMLYLPIASSSQRGAAKFNTEDFEVDSDGGVYIKTDRLTADFISKLSLSIENGKLVFEDDNNDKYGLYFDTDCKSVIVVTESNQQIYPGPNRLDPGIHLLSFTVTPASGYMVAFVKVNGNTVTPVGSIYSWLTSNSDVYIKVVYATQ